MRLLILFFVGVLLPEPNCKTTAGPIDSRDFCLHESFNASCRHGCVILMVSAVYGRMRLGRCVNGDFNIGCSKDVLTYFDSQCTGKQSCDVSIRNLVDIHPCQRDFMSYLEANYRCIEVAGYGLPVCPRDSRLLMLGSVGYFSNVIGPYRSPIGTESCPWVINARPGQKIHLKIILLHADGVTPVKTEEAIVCTTVFVVKDNYAGTKELGICAGKARERQFYTSTGYEILLFVSRAVGRDYRPLERDYPRFIVTYEAVGCPDLNVPSNAWIKRVGDNVMIKCNETMETWYFTCQRSQWIGDIGNCSQRVQQIKNDELKDDLPFPAHGIVLAVLIGILLGMFVGMLLLLTIHCARHRSKRQLKKRQALFLASYGSESADLTIPTFHRGSRTRDDRYPALLVGAVDKDCGVEKVYDFSGTPNSIGGRGGGEGGGIVFASNNDLNNHARCCYPISMVDYAAVDRSTADNLENARILSATDRCEAAVLADCTLYPRVLACPLCVRRNCECLQQQDMMQSERNYDRTTGFGLDDMDSGSGGGGFGGGGDGDGSAVDSSPSRRIAANGELKRNNADIGDVHPSGKLVGPDVALPLVCFQQETSRIVNVTTVSMTSSIIEET